MYRYGILIMGFKIICIMNKYSIAVTFFIALVVTFCIFAVQAAAEKYHHRKEKEKFIYRNICNDDSLKHYLHNPDWNE